MKPYRLVFAWCMAHPFALAAQAQPRVTAVLESATLSFSGHATVGGFVGTTHAAAGSVSGDLSGARGWVEAQVATLVTNNEHRDRDLRASMEVTKYPTMRFDLERTSIVSGPMRGDTTAVRLHGTFTIHGVSRAADLDAEVVRTRDAITVASTFPLDLEDYRIGGLTKAFGLLRMDHMIEVRLSLRFVVDPTPATQEAR